MATLSPKAAVVALCAVGLMGCASAGDDAEGGNFVYVPTQGTTAGSTSGVTTDSGTGSTSQSASGSGSSTGATSQGATSSTTSTTTTSTTDPTTGMEPDMGPDCQVDCTRPNATGGVCANNTCSGWSCQGGWGNCNGNWDDGCEQELNTNTHCAGCNTSCSAGANATATCQSGACMQSCTSPWENCDGDWQNGCEIPTGLPNQCDVNGLNAVDGCWTAYCGNSANADATNFGTYYCMDCVNCHEPAAGQWQWCSHTAGVFFPPGAGSCPAADKDAVCPAG